MNPYFKSMVAAGSFLLTLASVNAFAHPTPTGEPNPEIMGAWQYEDEVEGMLTATVTLTITPTYADFDIVCSMFGDGETTTHLRVNAQVGASSIWLGAGHASTSKNGLKCPISSPGAMGSFEVNAETLMFLGTDGKPQYASNGDEVVYRRVNGPTR